MHISKKLLVVSLTILCLAAVAVSGVLYLRSRSSAIKPLQSDKQTISFTAAPRATITNNGQIAGTYRVAKDQALFYMLSLKGRIVGSGTIVPTSDGTFSRNVQLTEKLAEGTPLTLKIYSQRKDGAITDQLQTDVRYRSRQ